MAITPEQIRPTEKEMETADFLETDVDIRLKHLRYRTHIEIEFEWFTPKHITGLNIRFERVVAEIEGRYREAGWKEVRLLPYNDHWKKPPTLILKAPEHRG